MRETWKKKMLSAVFDAAMEVNTFGQWMNCEGLPSVTIYYHGHCDLMVLRIFPHGWSEGEKDVIRVEIDCDDEDFAAQCQRAIDTLAEVMEGAKGKE